MHIPQIRTFGYDTAARFSLHSAVEHRQREDVHLHLVLVLHTGHHVDYPASVSNFDNFRSDDTAETAASVDEAAAHRDLPERQQKS